MDVLLVIDMQKSVFLIPRLNTDNVVSNINSLACFIRENGGLVLHVQHNGTAEDGLLEGTQGWEIIDELDVQADDMKITKTACDAFYKTDLASILTSLKVDNVLITGAATEFCVDTTLRSCLSKGFNLTAISDAHTTADRGHLSATCIVEHHNWTWENLIIPEVKLQVVTTAEWLSSH
ncbi:isochorismatase family protein [Marinomonas sp.]|uniref:isochorismatase family protein n=1 Tax=Marinomonas sp. TaxID=1904862 RepID=UPI003BACBB4A